MACFRGRKRDACKDTGEYRGLGWDISVLEESPGDVSELRWARIEGTRNQKGGKEFINIRNF